MQSTHQSPQVLGPVAPRPSIPKNVIEEISKCQVLTYTIEDGSKPGDNYMSVMYTVSAQVIPPGGSESDIETRHYLFKCYPSHPSHQTYLKNTNYFYNELCFYTIWTKELVKFQTEICCLKEDKVLFPAFPPCIGGKAINFAECEPEVFAKVCTPMENFIMMTDVRRTWGFQMADNWIGLEKSYIQLAFTEYATIHALSWAYRKKVDNNFIKKFPFLHVPYSNDHKDMWNKILATNTQLAARAIEHVLGAENQVAKAISGFSKNTQELFEFFITQPLDKERNLWNYHKRPPKHLVDASTLDEPWRIICHGDARCNNMLFKTNSKTNKPERIILVDFQWTREACPTADLVYTLYTSTNQQFRKAHLTDCLQVYYSKFVEICTMLECELPSGFSWDSFQRRFERAKVVGLMIAIMGLPIMLKEKEDNINLANMDENADMGDTFNDEFSSGIGGPEYQKRITEIAQEMFDDGVI